MIYKEEQETKLLRLKYEDILDGLDKQIDKLENWIGTIIYHNTYIDQKNKAIKNKSIVLNGIRRKIYYIRNNIINKSDERAEASPEVIRKVEQERRYSQMKKINKKYSNIVLTKRDTQKKRLEVKKAAHSLDLGVSKSGSIYKPNFNKLSSLQEGGSR